MSEIKTGDILISGGETYISMRMYKDLQNKLESMRETAEYFLAKLADMEVANQRRKSMRISMNTSKK